MSDRGTSRHALVAADRLAGLTWRQIAEKYGYASPTVAANTFRVARERMQNQPLRSLLTQAGRR